MAIIPLDLARRVLNADDYDDTLTERLINRAQETIEQITDRDLERQADTVEDLEAANGLLYPRRIPIETVSSITLDGQDVTGYELDGDTIDLKRYDYGRRYSFYRYRTRRKYRVTYTGGYIFEGQGANLPVSLSEAAFELVQFYSHWREFTIMQPEAIPGPRSVRDYARMIKRGIPRLTYDRLTDYIRQKPRVYDGF